MNARPASIVLKLVAAVAMLLSTWHFSVSAYAAGAAVDAQREGDLIANAQRVEAQFGFASKQHFASLIELGGFYEKAGNDRAALTIGHLALKALEQLIGPDNPALEEPLIQLADVHIRLQEYEPAVPLLRRALAFIEAGSRDRTQSIALVAHNLALCLVRLQRDDEEAEVRFRQALRALDLIHKDKPADEDWANVLDSWAHFLFEQRKDYAGASAVALHSLSITRTLPATPRQKLIARLVNVSLSLAKAGRAAEALPYAQESVSLHEQEFGASDHRAARALADLGALYGASGMPGEALPPLERARRVLEANRAPQSELELATVQHNLAAAHLSAAFAAAGSMETNVFVRLGVGFSLDEARKLAKRSAEARMRLLPAGHFDTRSSLVVLGTAEFLGSDAKDAVVSLHRALEGTGAHLSDETLVSLNEIMLCLAYARLGQEELAILWGKEAINTLHGVDAQERGLDTALEPHLQAQSRTASEIVVTLLVRQGRAAEAQQILQMFKERELYESYRGAADDPRHLRAELTGLELKRFSRFYELRKQQAALVAERLDLERKQASGTLSEPEKRRLRDITERDFPMLAQAMQQFLKRLETEMAASSSQAAQNSLSVTREATDLRKAVDHLARVEPQAGAVGLQYLVSKDMLTIILTVPGAPPIARQRPIDRPKFYAAARAVLAQMQSANADPKRYEPALREFYYLLIEPVRGDLQQVRAHTLMLSLDDHLRLLPFAALMGSDHRYLVQDYVLALYNEAAGQSLQSDGAPTWRVAAMGLSESVDGLPALSSVPDEIAGILRAPGLSGDAYLNRQFTRERLLRALNPIGTQPYNVLHVASHFVLKPGLPGDSVLYLGDGSRISLQDIAQEALDFSRFDLVTYSACKTASPGGRDAAGTEMESLSARTQRQGAQAVMATLWQVSDRSTGALMHQYYAMRGSGLDKAMALRASQLEMAEGRLRGQDGQSWASPHHWAAFVVAGNWR